MEATARRTNCRFHCVSCGAHFSSLIAFDLHRIGKYRTGRRCADPSTIKLEGENRLEIATSKGYCNLEYPNGREVLSHPVVIWRQFGAGELDASVFVRRTSHHRLR